MRKLVNALRRTEGYLGVEAIIVAGLMIAIGAFAIKEFYAVGEDVIAGSIDKVMSVQDITIGGVQ